MTRLVFLIKSCSLVFALLSGSCVYAETNKAPSADDVKKGKPLYETHCMTCHQKNGVGQPTIPWGIRSLTYFPAMPLNETSHAWHHSDEQLQQRILKGIKNRMPAFQSTLTEQQAAYLVAYIKSLWSAEIIACQGPKHMSCMRH